MKHIKQNNVKTSMGTYVVTRRILTTSGDERFLDNKMNLANRIYNNLTRHYIDIVNELYKDVWYKHAYKQ